MVADLLSESGLSLDRLLSFCRVAEAGGVTLAAKGDATKQSLYSRQIKELEEFFSAELVRRSGRGISLTPAGQQLHRIAREQFAALNDFKSECLRQPLEIVIGAGDSLIQWQILPKLVDIEKRLPTARLKCLNLMSAEIIDRLKEGLIDFGIVRKGEAARPLQSTPLGRMSFSLFVPKSKLHKPEPEDFNSWIGKIPLATLEGSGTFRQKLGAIAQKNKLSLNIAMEFSSFPLVARALAGGKVCGILPSMAAEELRPLKVIELPLKALHGLDSELCLVWNPRQLRVRVALDKARHVFTETLRLS